MSNPNAGINHKFPLNGIEHGWAPKGILKEIKSKRKAHILSTLVEYSDPCDDFVEEN